VGIGASAGGLEPIAQFIKQVPANSGLAYIVVQHLDPVHKALLAELLQNSTAMTVVEAEQDTLIEPDHVYVIPPNKELTVVDGRIRLAQPIEPRGLRLPIDALFFSLAQSQGPLAIAVVLSGMGFDGTKGLQAIKSAGGLTAAQRPESAQFDSMPKNAIDSKLADIIALPAELPELILSHGDRKTGIATVKAAVPNVKKPVQDPMERITAALKQHTRHDFSQYKPSTLNRRIARRMAIHKIDSPASYADFLEGSSQEIDLLFKEVLIGVTEFFRDFPVWEKVANTVLPELFARRLEQPELRAWVVGCSTGEEAFSLAILFCEAAEKFAQPNKFSLQIFASDISSGAIDLGRRGEYPLSISTRVSEERLRRFFTVHDNVYRVRKQIRDMVLFAEHDLLLNPPFTKLDFLSCRNLLIYFDAGLQAKLMPLFHYSLLPGGVMLLGSSETIGRFSDLFEPIDAKSRLYLRLKSRSKGLRGYLMTEFPPLNQKTEDLPVISANPVNIPDTLQSAANELLLQSFSPAAVVVNASGDITYISGRTGKYLEPAAGKANWNFHSMIREGLRAPVSEALLKAPSMSESIELTDLEVQIIGGVQRVDVTVQALREPAPLQGYVMIVFRDVAPPLIGKKTHKVKPQTADSLATELQKCRDQIYVLQEKARKADEERQTTHEELQSANEELQSSNEELTTSKEEMQSMNEELQTINAELHSKLDELSLAQSDLKNILNSTEIAILFLDQNLNVRRFTDSVSQLFKLRENDVGRPLSDLSTILQYPTLEEDARKTLNTLIFSEKRISASDDRCLVVRIMPYRRIDNIIDGLVITFVNVTGKS
jgi:two-component system CheB/CheR fusion protein